MPVTVKLTCPEGFSYHSWQRVVATTPVEGVNANTLLVHLAMETDETRPRLTVEEDCFFVLSGESFTLADLADAVQSALDARWPGYYHVEYEDAE